MLKHLKYLIVIVSLLVFIQPALAFDSKSILKIDTPYATFYPGSFDNLVLSFNVIVAKPDILKAVSLKNLGTADNLQISKMILWADAGAIGFQGLGIDRQVAEFKYFSDLDNWYAENLSEHISDSRQFYVTIELFSVVKSSTIQMQIPKLVDNNANASFDSGDLGIFMDSGNNGPLDLALTNSNKQVISSSKNNLLGPKIVITDLNSGQKLNDSSYLITGLARDLGNFRLSNLSINIDGTDYTIDNYDAQNYTWQYDWTNISDASHTLKASSKDEMDNIASSEEIIVTSASQTLAPENSQIVSDREYVRNDGLDKAVITVTLKDSANQSIGNRQVILSASDIIAPANKITDQNGKAIFEVRSTVLGAKTLNFTSGGIVLPAITLTFNSSGANIKSGDLIKAGSAAVYFFGSDGLRHAFPTLDVYKSWYSDFKNVKVITDKQLAAISIGKNVTFRPGVKLVKISTDPKVYAVDSNSILRWVKSEALAKSLYGANWTLKIAQVSDSLFGDYKLGADINKLADYALAKIKLAANSIGY